MPIKAQNNHSIWSHRQQLCTYRECKV